MTFVYKLLGNTIPLSTTGNLIPTFVSTQYGGSNTDWGQGTFQGYGNSIPGGATCFRVIVPSGTANLTISNGVYGNAIMQNLISNTEYVFAKYPYDLVSTDGTGVLATPIRSSGV